MSHCHSIVRTPTLRSRQVLPSGFPADAQRVRLIAAGLVVAEPGRCVQCGICTHGCPAGIDVRAVAREGAAVIDSRCLACGTCVMRCPRGTLRFHLLEPSP